MRHGFLRVARNLIAVVGTGVLFVGGCVPRGDGPLQAFTGELLRNMFAAFLL